MSLKEKRCFHLTPLITEREELVADFSGLTLPSTEKMDKDCWEEEHSDKYNERSYTSPKKVAPRNIELNESNFIPQLPDNNPSPLKDKNTTSLVGLHGYPDSPRPLGTSLFNDNVTMKKRDYKTHFRLWSNHQRRKQSSVHSPKQNSEALERNTKRKPSLRARLINRFILSTRRAVHEYAAAATAIISPSGDLGDFDRFQKMQRYAQDLTESTDVIQGTSCRVVKDHKAHIPSSSLKDCGNSVELESRVRSKSFPECSVQHNNIFQEENMSRMRSCSQVLDDDLYGTKSDDWLCVSGERTNFQFPKDSSPMPFDDSRDFSPVSPHIQDVLYVEENTKEQLDGIETPQVDEGLQEKEEETHQVAKYKKKMNLKLDLESVQDTRGGGSRIVPVKANKKKGSFV